MRQSFYIIPKKKEFIEGKPEEVVALILVGGYRLLTRKDWLLKLILGKEAYKFNFVGYYNNPSYSYLTPACINFIRISLAKKPFTTYKAVVIDVNDQYVDHHKSTSQVLLYEDFNEELRIKEFKVNESKKITDLITGTLVITDMRRHLTRFPFLDLPPDYVDEDGIIQVNGGKPHLNQLATHQSILIPEPGSLIPYNLDSIQTLAENLTNAEQHTRDIRDLHKQLNNLKCLMDSKSSQE